MYYLISKKQRGGSALLLNLNDIKGYKITPKIRLNGAIPVSEMTIIKKDFIKKIIKKKVRLMLENLDEESSDDTRKALDHVQRYKKIVNDKYNEFLEPKYISLLNQKIAILEREFKSTLSIKYEQARPQFDLNLGNYELEEKEEKENRRRR